MIDLRSMSRLQLRVDAAVAASASARLARACAPPRREEGDHRAELDYWRAKKLQQDVLEGRQELAEQIAATILDRLRAACDRLRAACAMHPDTADAVRALADELDARGGAALDALDAPDAEQPQEDEP